MGPDGSGIVYAPAGRRVPGGADWGQKKMPESLADFRASLCLAQGRSAGREGLTKLKGLLDLLQMELSGLILEEADLVEELGADRR